MKIKPSDETSDSDKIPVSKRVTCDNVSTRRKLSSSPEETKAESELAHRIFTEGNGRTLVKFCRELSGVLIRRYMVETDVEVMRAKVCSSLVRTLHCNESQAQCLVDLSLELIHARLHGKYRRSNVELSYLIATATGAVKDVTAN